MKHARWLYLAGIAVALLILCSACSAPRNKSDVFPTPQADFDLHVRSMLDYLTPRSLRTRSADEIALNLPFQRSAKKDVPYRGRFLLFHGLGDSAYVWSDMADAISQRGFDVRAVLLPGHGSHPSQMLDVSYKQWLATAREHIRLWRDDTTPLYLGGFSMGAVIASVMALEHDDIAGLLLFSPAFHSRLNHLLKWAWAYKRFRPWMFGGMILEDNPVKYNSIPINSVDQYYRTARYLKKKWGDRRVHIPTLAVMSDDDSVVNIDSVRSDLAMRFTHPQNRTLIYTNEKLKRKHPLEQIRRSHYPSLRILNQSHLSVLTSPHNRLYGKNASVLVCNGNEPKIFFACLRATGHWYGAQHTPSPDAVAVARTTYNPDWNHVLKLFDRVFGLE